MSAKHRPTKIAKPRSLPEQPEQAGPEDRLKRLLGCDHVEFLRHENYCAIGERDSLTGLSAWGYLRRIPEDESVSYGDMKEAGPPESAEAYLKALSPDPEAEGELYFFLPYASGSDYSGSTVERSNYKVFLEDHGKQPFVWDCYGGFGTYAVVIGLTGLLQCEEDTFDMILEIIEGLGNYPCIDDEALSELEMEGADEAWECWAASDFLKALEKKFDDVEFHFPDGSLRRFFEDMREQGNQYWECEGYGHDMWINIDFVVSGICWDDVEQYAIRYVVSWVDIGEQTEEYFHEEEAAQRAEALRGMGYDGAHYKQSEPSVCC